LRELKMNLNLIFDITNIHYYKGGLKRPRLVNGDGNWFESGNGNPIICVDRKFQNDPEMAISIVLHECVHLWCRQNYIFDCTPDQFHNEAFFEEATSHGLIAVYDDEFGWSNTKPKDSTVLDIFFNILRG
jgi:hypothetical protein